MGILHVEVREATASDGDAIAAVEKAGLTTLRETYRPTPEAIARRQRVSDQLTRLVATHGANVVGTVEYRIASGRLHFSSLFVHLEHRQKGVAMQIVAALKRIGKSAGVNCLSAYTIKETGNPAIFERMGFSIISEEPSNLFQGEEHDTVTESYLELRIT